MERTCISCGHQTEEDITVCPNDGTLLKKNAPDPLIGTNFLEKYEVTELLGKGGMSAVYKARHVLMNRFVAIKVLRPDLVNDALSLQRFQREAQAVGQLDDANIMRVHDFGLTDDGIPYLIADFLDGKTVSQIIRSEGQISPARCVYLFSQACDALKYAHGKGVIHRDIKPSNMIVLQDKERELLKIVDFGIAKQLESEMKDVPQLTTTGEVFGSPYYMSPEQCNGRRADARSDIYALGCVLYESLMGHPPLRGESAIETFVKHLNDQPLPFKQERPDLSVPAALEAVVFKALAKDPEERHQTMAELNVALKSSFGDKTTLPSLQIAVATRAGSALSATAVNAAPTTISLDRPVHCASCKQTNAFGWMHCVYCGERLDNQNDSYATNSCPKCHSNDGWSSDYCTSCGACITNTEASHAELLSNQEKKIAVQSGSRWMIGSVCVLAAVLAIIFGPALLRSQIRRYAPDSTKAGAIATPTTKTTTAADSTGRPQNAAVESRGTKDYLIIHVYRRTMTGPEDVTGKRLQQHQSYLVKVFPMKAGYFYCIEKDTGGDPCLAECENTLENNYVKLYEKEPKKNIFTITSSTAKDSRFAMTKMPGDRTIQVSSGAAGDDKYMFIYCPTTRLRLLDSIGASDRPADVSEVFNKADQAMTTANSYNLNAQLSKGILMDDQTLGNLPSQTKQQVFITELHVPHD